MKMEIQRLEGVQFDCAHRDIPGDQISSSGPSTIMRFWEALKWLAALVVTTVAAYVLSNSSVTLLLIAAGGVCLMLALATSVCIYAQNNTR